MDDELVTCVKVLRDITCEHAEDEVDAIKRCDWFGVSLRVTGDMVELGGGITEEYSRQVEIQIEGDEVQGEKRVMIAENGYDGPTIEIYARLLGCEMAVGRYEAQKWCLLIGRSFYMEMMMKRSQQC